MATFYRGPRPVLQGRNSNDAVHTWKNKVGNYSNWSVFNTSNVLDGAPDENHVPGEGRHPHGVQMSRRYRGLDTDSPMNDAGSGTRLSYHRTHPWEYKGLDSTRAMADPGHEQRTGVYTYSRWSTTNQYHGVPSANPLLNSGHLKRGVDAEGTANSYGSFDPHIHKGIIPPPLSDTSGTRPEAGTAGVYGHEHTTEWFGVPSAKAL
ncbi:MAG TPA: hypothetical protein VJ742_12125 [Nitrososphaera sp.]|nr:hypothetical protein [Nitrososphaera sp.]